MDTRYNWNWTLHSSISLSFLRLATPYFVSKASLTPCSSDTFRGRDLDVWALGVCLYLMVVGRLPFEADSVGGMYHRIVHEPLAFPPGVELSPELVDLLVSGVTVDDVLWRMIFLFRVIACSQFSGEGFAWSAERVASRYSTVMLAQQLVVRATAYRRKQVSESLHCQKQVLRKFQWCSNFLGSTFRKKKVTGN